MIYCNICAFVSNTATRFMTQQKLSTWDRNNAQRKVGETGNFHTLWKNIMEALTFILHHSLHWLTVRCYDMTNPGSRKHPLQASHTVSHYLPTAFDANDIEQWETKSAVWIHNCAVVNCLSPFLLVSYQLMASWVIIHRGYNFMSLSGCY